MIPALCVPILNRGDLLLRLFNSVDFPIDNFAIIVNALDSGEDPSVTQAISTIKNSVDAGHPHIKKLTITPGILLDADLKLVSHNMGVAKSWNYFLNYLDKAPYIIISGNDMMFTPGDLKAMHDTAMAANQDDTAIISSNHGFACFAILKSAVEKIGLFDENFYPAYLEDCDYHYRCVLAKMHIHRAATNIVHGEAPTWGSSTIYSNQGALLKKNQITHGKNYVYYNLKWGAPRENAEVYQYPFNDPKNSVKYWPTPGKYLVW